MIDWKGFIFFLITASLVFLVAYTSEKNGYERGLHDGYIKGLKKGSLLWNTKDTNVIRLDSISVYDIMYERHLDSVDYLIISK